MADLTCVICATQFVGRSDRRYCSTRCRTRRAYLAKVEAGKVAKKAPILERPCGSCNEPFTPLRDRTAAFCSNTCAAAGREGRVLLRLQPRRSCSICGTEFTPNTSTHSVCSKRCRARADYEAQKASGYRQGPGRAKRNEWARTNAWRRYGTERTCEQCGAMFLHRPSSQTGRWCSRLCAGASRKADTAARRAAQPPKPVSTYVPQEPGPLRKAIKDGDHAGVIEELRNRTNVTDSGCWEWQGRLKDGYPAAIRIGGTSVKKIRRSAHRVMAEAAAGHSIPSHLSVHHKCANTRCINPDHLQVVHPHENNAEMLERNYYLKRIAELEARLAELEAAHHQLRRVA